MTGSEVAARKPPGILRSTFILGSPPDCLQVTLVLGCPPGILRSNVPNVRSDGAFYEAGGGVVDLLL